MNNKSDDKNDEPSGNGPSADQPRETAAPDNGRESRIREMEALTIDLPGVVPKAGFEPSSRAGGKKIEPGRPEGTQDASPRAIQTEENGAADPDLPEYDAAKSGIDLPGSEMIPSSSGLAPKPAAPPKASSTTLPISSFQTSSRGWKAWLWILFCLAVISVLIKIGSMKSPWSHGVNTAIKDIIMVSAALDAMLRLIGCQTFSSYLKCSFYDLPLLAAMIAWFDETSLVKGLFVIRQCFTLFTDPIDKSLLSGMATRMKMNPAQIIVTTFLGVSFVGTVLLMLPYSSSGPTGLSFVDALFTSTSATCVTGLVTLDTGTDLSTFGQVITMILFQIGGLGIMTLSAAVAVIFSKRMNLLDQAVMRDMVDPTEGDVVTLLKYILRYTILIEAIGASILSAEFAANFGWSTGRSLYYGTYHAISAFCNAGFGLMSDSLAGLRGSALTNFTVMGLIILGGLGFSVLLNLNRMFSGWIRRRKTRMSLHTRIVLIMSGLLIAAGTLFFAAAEWNHSFAGMTVKEKLLAASFQSVTCRTAGFSTVDNALLTPSSILFAIMLMFIGASPGSTGGGIKTTTLAVLSLRVRALLSGRTEVETGNRTIPQVILHRSISIVFLSALVCFLFLLALARTENLPFMHLFFETISAFGTVGLSCGVTSKLSVAGKFLITLLMFIGRIGPLTLALAIGERTVKGTFAFPEEKVMVG